MIFDFFRGLGKNPITKERLTMTLIGPDMASRKNLRLFMSKLVRLDNLLGLRNFFRKNF